MPGRIAVRVIGMNGVTIEHQLGPWRQSLDEPNKMFTQAMRRSKMNIAGYDDVHAAPSWESSPNRCAAGRAAMAARIHVVAGIWRLKSPKE